MLTLINKKLDWLYCFQTKQTSEENYQENMSPGQLDHLVGHHPANREVTSSIPGQGTCLGCRPGPWLGACEKQPMDVSLALFLPPFPSL